MAAACQRRQRYTLAEEWDVFLAGSPSPEFPVPHSPTAQGQCWKSERIEAIRIHPYKKIKCLYSRQRCIRTSWLALLLHCLALE